MVMPSKEQIRTESEIQKQAFEFYYGLGSRRRYRIVAVKFEVSASTIKNWSKWHSWKQRIEEREAGSTRALEEQNRHQAASILDRIQKYLDVGINRISRDLVEGRAKTSPNDLAKLVGLRLDLLDRMQGQENSEGKASPGRVVLVMHDNGRDDCTLEREDRAAAEIKDQRSGQENQVHE
jgi:hypothetical protein